MTASGLPPYDEVLSKFPFNFNLSHYNVVFGEVLSGREVVRAAEKYGTEEGKPKAQVSIANCGEMDLLGEGVISGEPSPVSESK